MKTWEDTEVFRSSQVPTPVLWEFCETLEILFLILNINFQILFCLKCNIQKSCFFFNMNLEIFCLKYNDQVVGEKLRLLHTCGGALEQI